MNFLLFVPFCRNYDFMRVFSKIYKFAKKKKFLRKLHFHFKMSNIHHAQNK